MLLLSLELKASLKEIKRLKNEPLLAAVIFIIILITVIFVLWPVIKVITFPKLEDYGQLFTYSRWYKATLNSLFITLISTITCTLVAFLFAYTMARLDVPLKGLFKFITLLPIVSPPFIVALSYILLFGRQGIVTRHILHLDVDIYGWHGLWFVQTITFFPYAYAVIYGVLRSISPNMEYAAYNLGASRMQVFKDVFLPLARPGIAGGALMAAINVLADFGNPMMISGNFFLLPTEAYMQISGWFNMSTAAVLSTALLVPALCIFIINRKWVGKRSYVTITGKENSLSAISATPLVKWFLFSLCSLITLLILSIYGVLLYGAFTKAWGYNWSLTLQNMSYVFDKGREIYNSLFFAFASAILSTIFAALLSYIVQRKQVGINRFLDFLAILPGAIPGVFLGLGFAMAFNQKPLELTGTAAIMILALSFWNLPTCYSASTGSLQQIGTSLEEASLNLGANSFITLKNIIMPILKVPLISGLVISFLRSITCLSVVIFIYSAKTSVGTISILGLVQNGEWGSAAAFTVILISIAFLVLTVTQVFLRKYGKSIEL